MTEPARQLKDYRPQHDEDCASRRCSECDGNNLSYWHSPRHPELGRGIGGVKRHTAKPLPCSCGLDALLGRSSP